MHTRDQSCIQSSLMKTLNVDLRHCYGIKALQHSFDFQKRKAYAIYAANGAMKSSFAQVFEDIAGAVESRDRLFAERKTSRSVTDESGNALAPASVLVIRPYAEEFGDSAKTSTLLVDATLRKEYESLHSGVEKATAALLKALRAQSGTKVNIEREISKTFAANEDQFYEVLVGIRQDLATQDDAPLANVKYDVIFADKVIAFLKTEEVTTALQSYIHKYNELLEASTYFKRGTFNYYNGATIAKHLADHGFFEAKHSLRLNATTSLELSSEKELTALIQREKETLLADEALRRSFTNIEKLISKNANLREFEEYLSVHEDIVPKLHDLAQLKRELWRSYLKTHSELLTPCRH
jgi:hypothetical protein